MIENNIKSAFKQISILVPIYNEEGSILELYSRVSRTISDITSNYEIIFINDGSTDKSMSLILDFASSDDKVYFIDFTRNFGHQIALSAGLDYCRGNSAIIIDADLQDPPELINELYLEYTKGYDIVYAKRKARHGDSLIKKSTAKIFYRIMKAITNFNIPLDSGDFRIISRKVIDSVNSMPERQKFLRGQMAWLGYKSSFILYDRESRIHGKTGYSMSKMFKLAIDAITGFSNRPLMFVSRMGLIISLFSFFIILYAIFSHFILERTITGWTSLIISSMFIGGIQLLSIGVIGEYISRINQNSRERPLYVVEKSNILSKEKVL